MASSAFDLTGRTAIVTGAGRGIGKAIAIALAEAGADLAICSRTPSELEAVASEASALGRQVVVVTADVTKRDQVESLIEQAVAKFRKVDILVNNPGLYFAKPALETTDADWDYVMQVALHSQWYGVRAVGRHMVEQRYGKIINLGSTWGMVGIANSVAYGVAKGAVLQMTKALAIEWARYGIRVNAISPGTVRTSLTGPELEDPKIRQLVLNRTPLRYVAEPSAISPMAVYLAAAASDYMTGQILTLDGGQTSQ